MSQWVRMGLRTGILTSRYPDRAEPAPGVSPGLPLGGEHPGIDLGGLVSRCPTGALSVRGRGISVDYRRCVHCYRCMRETDAPLPWAGGYEWASLGPGASSPDFGRAFRRSIHLIVVDAGDCGACLNEVRQLNSPYYNMHRLGFFLTPSPRHADILLAVGPGTDQMRLALRKTYDAMPTPKRVMAVGACALSGGMLGPSFVSGGGIGDAIPVDVEVPGHPPPPLAILHGLLLAAGRATPSPLRSPGDPAEVPIASARGGRIG